MIIIAWSIILGLYILPVILVYYKTIRPRYRISILLGVGIFAVLFSFLQNWSLSKWGIRVDNIQNAFLPYLVFTLAGVILIIFTAWSYKKKPIKSWWKDPHLLYLFIPISVAQEVVYRGFLTPQLHTIFDSAVSVVIFNALLFTFLHIVFYDFKYVLPLLFLGGIGFSWMYNIYPNLILISISHCVLNFVAVRHGFFSTEHLKERKHKLYEWIDRWGIEEQKKMSHAVHLLFILVIAFISIYYIKIKVIPAQFVIFLVVIMALLSMAVSWYQNFSLKELGIRKDIFYGFCLHLIFTVVFGAAILLFSFTNNRNFIENIWQFLIPQVIISVGQAFIFRSFLIRQLQVIFSDSLVVILLSATIFTFTHIMYVDFSANSIFLFLAGLGFSWTYIKKPNLLWSALSHIILNILVVSLGALSII